jgi:hypothetical protein
MSGMPNPCADCTAILSEGFADAWIKISSDRALKEAWTNTYRMLGIGGSEEDKARLEESFPQVRAAELLEMKPMRIGRAMQAGSMHQALTGHKVLLRFHRMLSDSES